MVKQSFLVDTGDKVSKNFQLDYKVRCVEELDKLSEDKVSVYVKSLGALKPASVMMNLQASFFDEIN